MYHLVVNLLKIEQKLTNNCSLTTDNDMLIALIPTSDRYGVMTRMVHTQTAMKKRKRFFVFPNKCLNHFLFISRMALVMAIIACANQPVSGAKIAIIQTTLHIVGGMTTSYPRTIDKYACSCTGKKPKQ